MERIEKWLIAAAPVIRALAVLLLAVVTALTGDELLLDGDVRAAVLDRVHSASSFRWSAVGLPFQPLPSTWA